MFKLWLMSQHHFDVTTFKRYSLFLPQLMSQSCCCDAATLDGERNLTARVVYDVATFLYLLSLLQLMS